MHKQLLDLVRAYFYSLGIVAIANGGDSQMLSDLFGQIHEKQSFSLILRATNRVDSNLQDKEYINALTQFATAVTKNIDVGGIASITQLATEMKELKMKNYGDSFDKSQATRVSFYGRLVDQDIAQDAFLVGIYMFLKFS